MLCCLILVSVFLPRRGGLAAQTAMCSPGIPLSSAAMLDVPSSPEHLDRSSNADVVQCRVSLDVSDGSSLLGRRQAHPDGFKEPTSPKTVHQLQLTGSSEEGQVRVDGLSKSMVSLADKMLLRKYGTSEEEKSEPLFTEFATVSRFSGLSEIARQSSPKLNVHSKSSELSPHQTAGVDGHPSHEDLPIIDRVLVRRSSIPESKVSSVNEIQEKSDGWTSGDGCSNVDQNEPDGFLPRSANAVGLEVSVDEVEEVKDGIASAASVLAITATATATALLVPTCTPTSPTDTNKSITHESTSMQRCTLH